MKKETKKNVIREYLRLLRPKQWVKNVILFIPLFFSGYLFNADHIIRIVIAILSFSLLSSSIYIINDIYDIERDKLHPYKKGRPLASGSVSVKMAIILAIIVSVIGTIGGFYLLESEYFLILEIGYFVLMLLYSGYLKHFAIVDAIIIAVGFVLRVLGGAILIQVPMSAMLGVTVIGASLLISFGKRRAELSLTKKNTGLYRPVLSEYPGIVLDSLLTSLTAFTFISYTLFAYGFGDLLLGTTITGILPPLLKTSPWMLSTVPIAFYVIARYLILIYSGSIAERPEELWWKDRKMLLSILLWGSILFTLIYFDKIFVGI